VRIGVIDAVGEDLLAVDLDDLTSELTAIETELLDRLAIRDLAARLEVRDEHARGRELVDDLRERDVGAALEVRTDRARVLGLRAVIELLENDRANLAIELLESLVRDEPADDAEDAAQREQIAPHDLLDVGVLHLHRDLLAGVEARDVDLTDRCRCDRPRLELRERFGHRTTELLDDARLDVLVRARRHCVLQSLELATELLGEEVRHDGDQLADLDEQALELDDRALDAARVAKVHRA
jgi:hypothetical protein